MSAIDKASRGDVFDYHTTALSDPSAYGSYTQPPYATHLLYPPTLAEDSDPLHYVTSSAYSSQHDSYDENRSPYPDPRLRQPPQITSHTPTEGGQGDRVYVYAQSLQDLRAPPALSIFLSFGTKRVECLVELLPSPNATALKHYVLSAQAPDFHATGHHSFQVPLVLVMEGAGGQTSAPQAVEVGAFSYHGVPQIQSSQDLSRKRRLSSSSDDAYQLSNKRPLGSQIRSQDQSAFDAWSNSATSPFSLPTPTGNAYQNKYQQGASPRPYGHHYSTSSASQVSIKAPSPHTPSYSPSFATVNRAVPSPSVSVTPASRTSGRVSPDKTGLPQLVRTSTLPQSASTAPSPGQSFNPYAMYPHKATLKLNGNLDTMTQDWTDQEWAVQRRLVLFTRNQVSNTIHADFKAIAPEDRQPNSICISCIYWEEKKDCYVTSVDTIFLLESLVGVRFTVEEKNRIRRNLEGFRPLTVAKSKSDSEEFFKLIMGFPTPKPRNIEKDVKVFPWKILKEALKKIIGKYSASYSSTAGALPTHATPTSSYPSARNSVSSSDSQSTSGPMGMSVSAPASLTTGYPRQTQRNLSAVSTTSDLRLHVPASTAVSYSGATTFNYPSSTQPMTAPAGRLSASWDFAAFGAPETNTTIPGTQYDYNRNVSAPQSYSIPQGSYVTGYPTTSG